MADPIKVMLVDDSAVVRGLMSRALKADPNIEIVATASDGEMAIKVLQQHTIDVILLDIEMPVMDGLTALPRLIELSPCTHVIMASSLTQRNAEISMKAIEMGATDYVPKPTSRGDAGAIDDFYEELRTKVLALGPKAQQARQAGTVVLKPATIAKDVEAQAATAPVPSPTKRIDAIAIASSTGGPQALSVVLSHIKDAVHNVPVFITQHMPATFTQMLAEHLSRDTGITCMEAADDQAIENSKVYIAPGDFHMTIVGEASAPKIKLSQEPPVNFCRPAADPMFESLVQLYGDNLLVLVLTGMGSDGLKGAGLAKEAGATIVVQDEASSVVWGMPGAIANAGLATHVLPLANIAAFINESLGGKNAA